jgi:DNA-binding SARP family transcriptional activator/tetratricopeptide (TPR) repeat protein
MPTDMAKANLALLGGFRLQTGTAGPAQLSTKKAAALLAYLALQPGQVHARPKLAALLWGDRSEAQARDSLRQALSLVRKALSHAPPRALIALEDTISLEPTALNTDAIVFEDLAAQPGAEALEQAIGLYRGELLEGFQVPAPEFESWVTAERQRFREMALVAMTKLLHHHMSVGAVERGIRTAARLLAADPLQERVHRTLMELYCRQGRHAAALRQYRTCADLLAKELGIDPDATTKALRREILRGWNRQQGPTLNGPDPPAESVCDIENESPVTPPSPERRQVTVLICDLADLSALAARLDPEEVQALIAGYQRCCMPIISQCGGAAGMPSGAEMLAFFGYPRADEHDVESAIRAGLTLVEAISKLDGGRAGPLQLRVGIATGPVVICDFFGNGADQHGIVGEAVQLAGGLETLAEPNTVVIAASTRRLIGNLFDCEDLGQRALNGFSEPVPAWRVLATSGIDSRFEGLRATTTPLIGRDEEVELLLRRWRQTTSGEGRVVLLSGEPGIGKSRLTVALQEQVQAEPHSLLRYFCSPHHQSSALYPIISRLERAAGFRRDDTGRQRLDKLELMLAQWTNDLLDATPLIANLLSVPTGDRYPPLSLTPQKHKEKTLRALLAQVEGLAACQPVMMVFEDAHWIDPTSLELLDLIVDRVPSLPVLLIITFRPEFAPPWIGRPHVTLVTLNRLPLPQRAEMITGVTGGKALPKDIADQIIDRTDGVPLFIEELTKTVLESGILVDAGDHYVVTGPVAPLAIPTTLQASLVARLDRLATVKDVAQIGAAIGREFSHELIAAVASLTPVDLNAALERLTASGLISRRGTPPDATYSFKHVLVQDAAYATLLRSRRQQLHASIAKLLVERFPTLAESLPEVVAHHFTGAGLASEAIGYWRKAGQLASARSANREAVKFFEQALAVLQALPESQSTLEQAFDVRLEQRPVLSHLGEVRQTRERLSEAEALAGKLNDDRRLGRVLALMTNNHSLLGELDEAVAVGSRALGIARVLGDLELSILAKTYLAHADYHRGQYERVVELITDNLAVMPVDRVYEYFGLSAPASIYNRFYLVISLAELGRFAEAAEYEAEALRLADSSQNHYTVGLASYAAGTRHLLEGDWPKARARFEHVIAVYRAGNIFLQLHTAVASSAWARAQLCEASEALNRLRECEPLLQRAVSRGIVGTRGLTYHSLGRTCLLLGRLDEAHSLGHRALESSPCHPGFAAHSLHLLGDIATYPDRFDAESGEIQYHKALTLAEAHGMRPLVAHCHLGLGKVYRRTGQRQEAQAHLATATTMYREMNMNFWLEQGEVESNRLV